MDFNIQRCIFTTQNWEKTKWKKGKNPGWPPFFSSCFHCSRRCVNSLTPSAALFIIWSTSSSSVMVLVGVPRSSSCRIKDMFLFLFLLLFFLLVECLSGWFYNLSLLAGSLFGGWGRSVLLRELTSIHRMSKRWCHIAPVMSWAEFFEVKAMDSVAMETRQIKQHALKRARAASFFFSKTCKHTLAMLTWNNCHKWT